MTFERRKNFNKKQPFSIKVKTVDGSIEWVPSRTNYTDACFNVKARKFKELFNEKTFDSYVLDPDMTVLAYTGFILDLRPGWEAQFRTNMDLIVKNGLSVFDQSITINNNNKSESSIILVNNGDDPIELTSGYEVAQMVINKVPHVKLWHVEEIGYDSNNKR